MCTFYTGPLYNLKRGSGGGSATKDVSVINAGGVADTKAHEAFCGTGVCIVQTIYDQSPHGNHLGIEDGASNLGPPRNAQDSGVNFTDPRSKAVLGGRPVYAAFFAGSWSGGSTPTDFVGQGYSNRTARATAVGDEPQSMYAVFGGNYYNGGCW